MRDSDATKHRPSCLLSHDIINKLSVIVGNCDLMLEFEAGSELHDAALRRRVEVIRGTAAELAKNVTRHACNLDTVTRTILLRDSATESVENSGEKSSRVEVREVDGQIDPLKTDGDRDQRRIRPSGITLAHMAKRVGK
jgi:hypothetical protein